MAPFQTTVNIRQDNVENLGQDVIDVQILPEEENWAENTTAITGNTSERSESIEGVDQWLDDKPYSRITLCRYVNIVISIIVIASAFVSPLLMVILPKLGLLPDLLLILPVQQKLMYSSCNIECKGHLVALIFKVALLGIGHWAMYFRSRKIFIPRLCIFQTGVTILTILSVSTYWLFYIVQVMESAKTAVIGDLAEYKHLVNYADNLINTLLFIHFTAVIITEIRPLKPLYYLKVVRSPDGESKSYTIGQLSIQQAATWILEKYYTEFSIYNPYLERLPVSKSSKSKNSNFKFYDVDNTFSNEPNERLMYESDRAILTAQARRRDSSHNERFYEEHEYDRRVKKRKARLITATEEAFAHIQRVNSDARLTSNPLNPMEAAQSVFPSMARALQKYLRITRQQPRHSVDTILKRLAYCIAQDASPRAFLEPFFHTTPVLANEKEQQRYISQWALVCEGELPSRLLSDNCTFQLRQGEIALLCSVHRLPNFYITEQIALPKSNRFLLKFNSETTV